MPDHTVRGRQALAREVLGPMLGSLGWKHVQERLSTPGGEEKFEGLRLGHCQVCQVCEKQELLPLLSQSGSAGCLGTVQWRTHHVFFPRQRCRAGSPLRVPCCY